MTFGQRIKHYRKNLGYTQSELAEAIGVTTQAISKWETDSSMPDISQIVPLARILATTTDILLGMDESEDKVIDGILEEGERVILSGGKNALTLGVENNGQYYDLAYRSMLEKTKRYPYNTKLLIRCAEYGIHLLWFCQRKRYSITEEESEAVYKDIKKLLVRIIDMENDLSCAVRAKRLLAQLYSFMGNEKEAYAVAEGLPRKYKLRSQIRIAQVFGDYDKMAEFSKRRYADGVCEFLCSSMSLYEVYTVQGKPKRDKAIELINITLAFLEAVRDSVEETYYLQNRIVYLKRKAMEHLRDGDIDLCLDCIEAISDDCISLYYAVTENNSNEESDTFRLFGDECCMPFGEDPQKEEVIEGLLWTLRECYAECGDRKNNPVVKSERYKKCVERITSLR